MIARGFTQAGAKVYISSRKAEVCDAAAAEIALEGGRCLVSLPADLSTEAGCEQLAESWPSARTGSMSWSTTPAPPGALRSRALTTPLGTGSCRLNVKGVFHLTRSLVPLLESAPPIGRSVAGDQHRLH